LEQLQPVAGPGAFGQVLEREVLHGIEQVIKMNGSLDRA
jgi:hypothetical protein